MSDHTRAATLICHGLVLALFCLGLTSCGNLLLPPLEVISCGVDSGTVVVEFSLPPSLKSLAAGLTVTEDGERMEGEISVSGSRGIFVPRYGVKEHRDYVVRVEAGTEDENGHSLMEAFVYEYSTRNPASAGPLSVDLQLPPDSAENRLAVGGEPHVLGELSHVRLEFSAPVDRKSLEAGLSLSPTADYVLVYENQDRLVTLRPVKDLEVNQRYVLSLAPSVMDVYRNRLPEESRWSFFYRLDVAPPDFTFGLLPDAAVEVDWEDAKSTEIAGTEVQLDFTDWVVLEFDEAVDVEQAASMISLEIRLSDSTSGLPPLSSIEEQAIPSLEIRTIPPLENRPDYKNGRRMLVRPSWNSGEESLCWGGSWILRVDAGIEDLAGNGTASARELALVYDRPDRRPPEFLGAVLTDNATGLEAVFSPKKPLGEMELEPERYPNTAETLPSQTEFRLFFAVSETATMDRFSLMEQVSLLVSNGCCDLTLKKLLSVDDGKDAAAAFAELERSLDDGTGSGDESGAGVAESESAGGNRKIVMAAFRVELENRDGRGLVTLELGPELSDSLGNCTGRQVVCRVNKL